MQTYLEQLIEKFGEPVYSGAGGQCKFVCPECGKSALSADINRGLYNCFHCLSVKGRLMDGQPSQVVDEIEIDPQLLRTCAQTLIAAGRLTPMYQKYLERRGVQDPDRWLLRAAPANPVHWLRKQGLTDDQLLRSGLFFRGYDNDLVPRRCIQPGRLLIPYWNGPHVLAFKSRVNPLEEDNEPQRYLTPTGFKIGHFAWNHGLNGGRDLIITEGEMKAIVAQERGFNCASISGLGVWKTSVPHLQELVEEQAYERVFIILDADEHWCDKVPLLRAALGLRKEFDPRACVVFLPQTKDNKVGLDDYLLSAGADNLRQQMEKAWNERTTITKQLRQSLATAVKAMRDGHRQSD